MKSFPSLLSLKHRLGSFFYDNPGASVEQACQAVTMKSAHYVREQVSDLVGVGLLIRDGDSLRVCGRWAKHMENLCDPAPEYVGEIVPARTATPFKPLTALPWAQHLDRIRTDVGFLNGSIDFRSGYQA